MPAADLKRRWNNGEVAYGAAIRLPGTWASEVFGHAGFDFVYYDLQHGMLGVDDLMAMFQALNGTKATPIVRIAANDNAVIGQVLDRGAEGIIVPMVESAEDAAKAVASCRYGVAGTRSRGGTRLRYLPGGPDRDVICLVMIETETGVRNVEEIVGVPGVDGVFVGPSDLALSYGLEPKPGIQPGLLAEVITTIKRVCDEVGKVTTITGDAQEMKALGFRAINIGGDTLFLEAAMTEALRRRGL